MNGSGERQYYCLDMALVDDEALVVLAKECDYSPARDEILIRYSPQTERMIQWMSRTTEFDVSEVEDARQNAVFWTVEAISKYDTDQSDRERRCSFYSFLYRVLAARFKDFTSSMRRRERRTRLASDESCEMLAMGQQRGVPNDPAAMAEAEEAHRRLQSILANLDEESRQIWDQLCDGSNLRDIAAQLGLSYDAAKRRRRKLIATLKSQLQHSAGAS